MENLKLCKYCSSEIISKECMITHKAHMTAVEQSHKQSVDIVNKLVCKKIITSNEWNKMYTDKFNEIYELKINYLLKTYSDEYNNINKNSNSVSASK